MTKFVDTPGFSRRPTRLFSLSLQYIAPRHDHHTAPEPGPRPPNSARDGALLLRHLSEPSPEEAPDAVWQERSLKMDRKKPEKCRIWLGRMTALC